MGQADGSQGSSARRSALDRQHGEGRDPAPRIGQPSVETHRRCFSACGSSVSPVVFRVEQSSISNLCSLRLLSFPAVAVISHLTTKALTKQRQKPAGFMFFSNFYDTCRLIRLPARFPVGKLLKNPLNTAPGSVIIFPVSSGACAGGTESASCRQFHADAA